MSHIGYLSYTVSPVNTFLHIVVMVTAPSNQQMNYRTYLSNPALRGHLGCFQCSVSNSVHSLSILRAESLDTVLLISLETTPKSRLTESQEGHVASVRPTGDLVGTTAESCQFTLLSTVAEFPVCFCCPHCEPNSNLVF